MSDSARLSVIIPAYNEENHIRRCVDSIIKQTLQDLDIIIVDDGSRDRTPEICDEYAANDPRIKVIHQNNQGLCAARKNGIRAAETEYVTFVDADDWIDPDMYERLLKPLAEEEADVITSGFVRNEEGERFTDAASEGIYTGDALKALCDKIIYDGEKDRATVLLSVWNKIYKKNILEPLITDVPENIYYCEDLAYAYTPFMQSGKVIITHDIFYHYFVNPNSMSNNYNAGYLDKLFYSFGVCGDIYSEYGAGVMQSLNLFMLEHLYNYVLRITEDGSIADRLEGGVGGELARISRESLFTEAVDNVIQLITAPMKRRVLTALRAGRIRRVIGMCGIRHTYFRARRFAGRCIREIIPAKRRAFLFRKNALKYLAKVTDELNINGVTAFADFGTLLGLVREGRILKHDRDVDVGVLCTSPDIFDRIDSIFMKMGFRMSHEFTTDGEVRERSYTRDGVKIDIQYYFADEEDSSLMYCWLFYGPVEGTFNREWYTVLKKCPKVEKLREITVKGKKIRIPANAETLLEYKYGKGWTKPDKGWNYWEGPNTVKMDVTGISTFMI